jgi:nucleoside-diphosphate-sugar epimerase
MRLLVTGATGFVGSQLAIEAARRGHEVIGIGRSSSGKVVSDLIAAGVHFVPGDFTDPAFVAEITCGVTHICHLAAAWREAAVPAEYFEKVNVTGSMELARAAAANQVKTFIFCSTVGVHPRSSSTPVREDTPFDVTNPYESSKLHAEERLREFATQTDMRIVIFRPADAYGPGDTRLLRLFRLVKTGKFPLVGQGSGRRHMLFVSDLVDAFLAACAADLQSGEVFIIAGPESTTLLELLSRLRRLTGSQRFGFRVPRWPIHITAILVEDSFWLLRRKPPLHRRTLDFYRTDVVYDTTKAQRALQWRPSVGFDEGLRRTLDWYRACGLIDTSEARHGTARAPDVERKEREQGR